MQARSCDPGENAAMTFQIAEKTLMVCPKSKNKPWFFLARNVILTERQPYLGNSAEAFH